MYWYAIYFFQVDGVKRISIGKSSNLPASMSKESIILDMGEKSAKFCVGPTKSRPGPILLKVHATAVKLVTNVFSAGLNID